MSISDLDILEKENEYKEALERRAQNLSKKIGIHIIDARQEIDDEANEPCFDS